MDKNSNMRKLQLRCDKADKPEIVSNMSDFIENDEGWPFLKVSEEQAIRDSTRPYDSKKNVWVPDPEDGFVTAEVRGSKGDLVSVVTDKGNE
uniref:Myosin N-terminal SH3-like domain-containing protein n=1 Tax=Romanomermis culicivorax TaxID=13658 RepID=A0A915I615_ROMCU